MSQFQATKCDECGRIQGEANHWLKMAVHYSFPLSEKNSPRDKMQPELVALGQIEPGNLILGHSAGLAGMMEETTIHDLCGQGCAVKHIAKLLKWNLPEDKS